MTVGAWARRITRLVRAEMTDVAVEASPRRIVWSRAGKHAILQVDSRDPAVWWLTDIDPDRGCVNGHRSFHPRQDEASAEVVAGNILGFFEVRFAIENWNGANP
jgi:hypothetical protein